MTTWRMMIAFAVACGPTAHPAAKKAEPPKHEDSWHALGFEDRHSVMTFKVLPNMGRTWRDWKKTEWPEMTCRTCHGRDAEAVSYRMPNPSLPPIDPAHPPVGPAAEFMRTRIVPEMIDLLGTTPERFSCNTCHPKVKT